MDSQSPASCLFRVVDVPPGPNSGFEAVAESLNALQSRANLFKVCQEHVRHRVAEILQNGKEGEILRCAKDCNWPVRAALLNFELVPIADDADSFLTSNHIDSLPLLIKQASPSFWMNSVCPDLEMRAVATAFGVCVVICNQALNDVVDIDACESFSCYYPTPYLFEHSSQMRRNDTEFESDKCIFLLRKPSTAHKTSSSYASLVLAELENEPSKAGHIPVSPNSIDRVMHSENITNSDKGTVEPKQNSSFSSAEPPPLPYTTHSMHPTDEKSQGEAEELISSPSVQSDPKSGTSEESSTAGLDLLSKKQDQTKETAGIEVMELDRACHAGAQKTTASAESSNFFFGRLYKTAGSETVSTQTSGQEDESFSKFMAKRLHWG